MMCEGPDKLCATGEPAEEAFKPFKATHWICDRRDGVLIPVAVVETSYGPDVFTESEWLTEDPECEWTLEERADGMLYRVARNGEYSFNYRITEIAVHEKLEKAPARFACCPRARRAKELCTCECVTVCPIHGQKCHGRH